MRRLIRNSILHNKKYQLAFLDILDGLFRSNVGPQLALLEVKHRYRRSVLGPFWITLSMGVMILGMGPIYGRIFNQDLGHYYQYIAVGFVLWGFISSYINEVCLAFIDSEGLIKQVKLPYCTYIIKVLIKNIILLAHNSVILIVVFLIFPTVKLTDLLFALVGFALLLLNLFWVGFVLSITCARYRDVPPVISSINQVLFFLTPILWEVGSLGSKRELTNWNPIYYLIEIIRGPLMGSEIQLYFWFVSLGMAIFGYIFALLFFVKFRSRISYWI